MADTVPQAFTRAFQQFNPSMTESGRMQVLREEILATMQKSVGINLSQKPATLSTPINPTVNHFRRSIKNPVSTLQPASTSTAGLSDPILEEHTPPHTPVRKPTNPASQGEPPKSKAAMKEENEQKATLSAPTQVEPPKREAAMEETDDSLRFCKQQWNVGDALVATDRKILAGETLSGPLLELARQTDDQEEDMHVDKPVVVAAAKKKKKTFEIEIDPAEMAGISGANDFPVTKSSNFFRGFVDKGDDEEEEAMDLESAMMSEAASTMVSPDSSANSSDDDDEIDFDDKGAVIDEEEEHIVNKETNQVKRKKEEPKASRKKTPEPSSTLPSEQDMATALLLELERCMVPNIAQINMILAKEENVVFNVQHSRLINIWTSFFSSSWSSQEWNTGNIFVQRINALYAKWTTKKGTTPSYGRITHLVDQLRQVPCCECTIQGGRLAKPDGVECYVSGVKATAANLKEFSRVQLTLQTKTGDVCKEIAFYCHQKYKKLITSLYFSLHNSSWVALMSSADKSVQDNVETNEAAFFTNCIETLQTLQTYEERL